MQPECPMCQIWRDRGAKFCAACGRNLSEPTYYSMTAPKATVLDRYPKPSTDARTPPIFRFAIILVALLVTLIVANNVFLTLINFNSIVDDCSTLIFSFGLTYGFGDIVLFRYHGASVAIVLGICIFVEGLFLVYALDRFHKALNREKTQGDGMCVERSGLSAASGALCVSLVLSAVLLLFASMSGNSADAEWMSKFTELQMLFLLTKAGLEEEFMLRIFWIGVPMAVIALAVHQDRRSWQYLMGGFGMSKIAIALIVFSSVLFGLAHLEGWGWGKVPSAAITGLIFGYLYTEYGLYAAVLAHTANDTMTSLAYSFGAGMDFLVVFAMIALGVVILIYWIIKLTKSKIDLTDMPLFPDKLETGFLDQWNRH